MAGCVTVFQVVSGALMMGIAFFTTMAACLSKGARGMGVFIIMIAIFWAGTALYQTGTELPLNRFWKFLRFCVYVPPFALLFLSLVAPFVFEHYHLFEPVFEFLTKFLHMP